MNISSKTLKQLLILWLLLLLANGVKGNIEIEAPAKAAETIENLDEISRKQLDYFLEIIPALDTINRTNFFKPYHKESKEKISHLLVKAAEIEPDECHKKYLLALAHGVLNDTFHSQVPEWFNLEENKTEIVFLPNETHMAQEFWLTLFLRSFPVDWEQLHFQHPPPFVTRPENSTTAASSPPHKIFDAFIFLNNYEETQRFEEYIRRFDKMADRVPYRSTEKVIPYKSAAPLIKIAHLVYSSLPGRVSFVYPDREVFYHYGRFKIVIFKNLIDAYVECILKPLSEKILSHHHLKSVEINSESFLSNLVMHKMAHHMGPLFLIQTRSKTIDDLERQRNIADMMRGKRDTERQRFESKEIWSQKQMEDQKKRKEEMELKLISETLGDFFPVVEEMKASIIGIHNTAVLIEEGLVPQEDEMNIYATYLVSLVDKLRKDPKNPLNPAYAFQFNFLLRNGAISFNINTKKISINLSAFPQVVKDIAEMVIYRYKDPYPLIRTGGITPELKVILKNLEEIPGDVNIDINVKTGLQANVKEE